MKNFWASRVAGWKSATRSLLLWDVARAAVFVGFSVLGWCSHPSLGDPANRSAAATLFVAIATFGTFLASFVLVLMSNVGKRELALMPNAQRVEAMVGRLRWLMSDQLIMVVAALGATAAALTWLAVDAILGASLAPVTALSMGFAALALINALRLPVQIWELQSSALEEEKRKAFAALNQKVDDLFDE